MLTPGPPGGAAGTCPQCGSGLPSNTRFCAACGHAVEFRSAPARPITADPTGVAAVGVHSTGIVTAGPGVRAAAFLLDLAVMISPALPLSIVGALLGIPEVISIVVPVAFASVWVWLQTWAGLTGKTVGKAMLGLRMLRDDRAVPGFGAAALRGLIFAGTLGTAALPMLFGGSGPRGGLHDRICGLAVLDVTVGDNPLGARPQTPLRRSSDRSVNRVESPIPVSARRRA